MGWIAFGGNPTYVHFNVPLSPNPTRAVCKLGCILLWYSFSFGMSLVSPLSCGTIRNVGHLVRVRRYRHMLFCLHMWKWWGTCKIGRGFLLFPFEHSQNRAQTHFSYPKGATSLCIDWLCVVSCLSPLPNRFVGPWKPLAVACLHALVTASRFFYEVDVMSS